MYFPESVNGLEIGSPLQFRGVKIGQVTEISAKLNKDLSVTIPVYVEYFPGSLAVPDEMKKEMQDRRYPFIHRMVAKGLKAQLRMKSLITGQLFVALDFFPDKPIRLVGLDKQIPEIPTIPSTSEVLMETLEKIPIGEIANNLLKVTEGVERIVNSPEMKGSMKNLDVSLQQLAALIRDIDAEVKPLTANLKETSTAARDAFTQAQKTLAFNEGKPGEMAESFNITLKKVDATLEEMRLAITTYENARRPEYEPRLRRGQDSAGDRGGGTVHPCAHRLPGTPS